MPQVFIIYVLRERKQRKFTGNCVLKTDRWEIQRELYANQEMIASQNVNCTKYAHRDSNIVAWRDNQTHSNKRTWDFKKVQKPSSLMRAGICMSVATRIVACRRWELKNAYVSLLANFPSSGKRSSSHLQFDFSRLQSSLNLAFSFSSYQQTFCIIRSTCLTSSILVFLTSKMHRPKLKSRHVVNQ